MTRGDEPLVQSAQLAASFRDGTLHLDALEAVAQGFRLTLTGEAGAGLLPASAPEPLRRSLGGDARAHAHLSIVRADEASSGTKGEPLSVEADLETDALSLESVRAKATVTGLVVEVQDVRLRPDRDFTLELAAGLLTLPTVVWHGGDNDLRTSEAPYACPREEDPSRRRPWTWRPRERSTFGCSRPSVEASRRGASRTWTPTCRARPRCRDVNGSLSLEAAVFRYRPWRISLDDVSARLLATPGRLVLESLAGTLNGGTLEGKGELRLSGAKPSGGQVALTLTGAALDWPKGFRGALDGGLELQRRCRGTSAERQPDPGQRRLQGRSPHAGARGEAIPEHRGRRDLLAVRRPGPRRAHQGRERGQGGHALRRVSVLVGPAGHGHRRRATPPGRSSPRGRRLHLLERAALRPGARGPHLEPDRRPRPLRRVARHHPGLELHRDRPVLRAAHQRRRRALVQPSPVGKRDRFPPHHRQYDIGRKRLAGARHRLRERPGQPGESGRPRQRAHRERRRDQPPELRSHARGLRDQPRPAPDHHEAPGLQPRGHGLLEPLRVGQDDDLRRLEAVPRRRGAGRAA